MSFATSVTKIAINCVPNKLISFVANIVLKDIAEINSFYFDIDTRELYTEVQLVGESETIEVWFEDFTILTENDSYQFIIQRARSNRIWLNNILSRIAGKGWKIPVTAQLEPYIKFVAELLKADKTEQEDS